MRSLWLLAFLLAGAAARPRGYGWGYHHDDDNGEDDECAHQAEELKAQSEEIDHLTHQMRDLEELIDHMPDADTAGLDIAEMDHDLDILEGNECEPYAQFSCRTDQHKCISSVMMCDGEDDCGNGADEDHLRCDVSEAAGTSWRGDVVYDHCTRRRPKVMELQINKVETLPYFKARPQITAHLLIEHHTDEADYWTNFELHGYWNPAERAVVLTAPESDGLGFACEFHGHDRDTCIGYVFKEGPLEKCAEFIFHRQ